MIRLPPRSTLTDSLFPYTALFRSSCETAALPPREGPVVIGIDLGGSASMSAAAYYWPQTGRLEVLGTFPTRPSLLNRGQADGVGSRYVEMESRGELSTLGEATVPVDRKSDG